MTFQIQAAIIFLHSSIESPSGRGVWRLHPGWWAALSQDCGIWKEGDSKFASTLAPSPLSNNLPPPFLLRALGVLGDQDGGYGEGQEVMYQVSGNGAA